MAEPRPLRFLLLSTCVIAPLGLCEPAHVLWAAPNDPSEPGMEAFAPAGTPAQYAPDRTLDLTHADITVFPDLVGQRVTGVVEYQARLIDLDATEITMDAIDLHIDAASIDGTTVALRRAGDRVLLALPDGHDDELAIRLEWRAAPSAGLYFMGPDDEPGRARALRDGDASPRKRGLPERRLALQAWTQGEMHETSHWLPTWDYPNDRFSSAWHIVAPAGLSVVANGESLGAEPLAAAKLGAGVRAAIDAAALADGAVWHFEQRDDHVSYLLSFVVGRFDVVREQWRGKPVEYWVPPGRTDEARASFEQTPEMLEFFSTWIGVEFPWAKYAQTTVQEFTFGGMENVSTTTMTDQMLHPARLEPIADRQGLVAHELAHQWWGDLLTCADWSHVWLNEGFATYFAALWHEHAEGPDAFALNRRGMASSYFGEARRYQRAIVTNEFRRASMMFDRHTYPKGGWVLHMLRRELGDADFRRALSHYAQQHRFSLVETGDLQRAIREATGRNLDAFFEQWVYAPGHPQLRSSWRYDAASKTVIVTIEQLQARVFAFDLELAWAGDGGPGSQRVRIDQRATQVVLASAAAPAFVLVDAGMHLLAELDHHQREDQWIAQLHAAPHAIDRLRAAEVLAKHDGPAVIDALRQAARDDGFHGVRSQATSALGHIGDDAAKQALLELWTAGPDPDARVQQARLLALGKLRAPLDADALALLLDVLDDEPNDYLRAAAATSLARFDGRGQTTDKRARKHAEQLRSKAQKALRRALEQRSFNVEVEQSAARSLAVIGDAKQLDLLLELLADIRPTPLRIAAAAGVVTMYAREDVLDGDARRLARESVAALLDDPNMRVRRAVLDDIAKLELPDAHARLRHVAEHDANDRVRSAAEHELRALN